MRELLISDMKHQVTCRVTKDVHGNSLEVKFLKGDEELSDLTKPIDGPHVHCSLSSGMSTYAVQCSLHSGTEARVGHSRLRMSELSGR